MIRILFIAATFFSLTTFANVIECSKNIYFFQMDADTLKGTLDIELSPKK